GPNEGWTFVVGSALSMPIIPNVNSLVDLVLARLGNSTIYKKLIKELNLPNVNRYQVAMERLEQECGRAHVNHLIFDAVLKAVNRTSSFRVSKADWDESGMKRLPEEYIEAWPLPPAVESLGRLIVHYGERFGKDVLTTNFDPLIEVSIRRAGGHY